ncbi:MAG: HEAT repeat domain-containing protein [Pirellulales bacterium]
MAFRNLPYGTAWTILLLAISGCANGPPFSPVNWASLPSLWADDEVKLSLVTPSERVAELQATSENAAGLDDQAKVRLVAELAGQLPNEADPLVREQIVRTLAALSMPQSISALRMALGDSAPTVRVAACNALGKLPAPEAQAALLEALGSDTDIDVRLAAADALKNFPDRQTVDGLAMALDDRDPALQYRAMQTLREVTGQPLGNSVTAWRQYVRGENVAPAQPASVAQRLRDLAPF